MKLKRGFKRHLNKSLKDVDIGNTIEIRQTRARKSLELIKNLGFDIYFSNLSENEDKLVRTEVEVVNCNCEIPMIAKYVTIDLTNKCNLKCIGCWIHSPLLYLHTNKECKSKQLDFKIIKRLIKDLKRLGTQRIRLTGGGEPFLYPKIMEVIKIIKRRGMACDITTNFTLVDENKIKRLFKLDVDEIVISLWAGDPETYVKTHPN